MLSLRQMVSPTTIGVVVTRRTVGTRRSIAALMKTTSSLAPSPAHGGYVITGNSLDTISTDCHQNPRRSFSFYGNNNNNPQQTKLGGPSYQVYGETTALTVRAIPPEFRQLAASGTIVSSSKGRLLLQWTPRDSNGKYQWDTSIRFALAPEEAASVFMARLDPHKLLLAQQQQQQHTDIMPDTIATAEIVRRASSSNSQEGGFFASDHMPEKVFRARLQGDGSVQLTVDYERDGVGGQEPPTPSETTGPLHIDLMVGEYHVLRSIVEYSIPKLIGWSPMLDAFVEQAVDKSTTQNNNFGGGRSPHNYQGNNDDGVPF